MHRSLVVTAVALCASVLASSSAHAQATTDLFTIDTKIDLTGNKNGFNATACAQDLDHELIFRVEGLSQPDYFLTFVQYPTTGPQTPCPTTNLLDPLIVPLIPAVEEAPAAGRIVLDQNIKTSQIIGTAACADDGARDTVTFCAVLTTLPGDTQAAFSVGIPVDFDTHPPPEAQIASIVTGDTSITVNIVKPSADVQGRDTFTYSVDYRLCATGIGTGEGEGEGGSILFGEGEGEGQPLTAAEGEGSSEGEGEGAAFIACGATGAFTTVANTSPNDPTVVITGLKPNQQLEVRAFITDDFGNKGVPSTIELTATVPDLGPLDLYDGAGGQLGVLTVVRDVVDDDHHDHHGHGIVLVPALAPRP